jgi:uncharacterized protein with NAD-binding domain and iron-sulfur cluster
MPRASNPAKVVILGGGVAGMSAAHELIERGFQVEVYERKSIAGGKARSLQARADTVGDASFGRGRLQGGRFAGLPLPAEHGFRFFPGFYKHVVDSMSRIPYGGGCVADNLVKATAVQIAAFERPPYALPATFPSTGADLRTDITAAISVLSGGAGIKPEDVAFFATKVWQLLTSCEERRYAEYEKVNWWDFIDAGSRPFSYQRFFGSAITRSLVAAKARRASTKTIGDIFTQLLFDLVQPGAAADRLLNGPTNDVWISPWLDHLRARGVVYHMDSDVRAIRCEHGKVRSAWVSCSGAPRDVRGDYFIGALPVERMAELVTLDLLKCDSSLFNLNELTDYVEWMNGIQFYLKEDVPLVHGHAIFIDSPWALTALSQIQFWKDYDLASCADGRVRGVISVDISDWDVKGLNGKEARHCSRQEIALETWEQLKRSLNHGREILQDRHLHSWFLDPDIEDRDADADVSTPRMVTNAEPLLVNYVDTWRIRPEAVTRIPNFFLASDYVRTFTDLATMEAANEAARRAVNGILRAQRSAAEPCALWNLHEPEPLLPLRAYDRRRFREGLPWDEAAVALGRTALQAVSYDQMDSAAESASLSSSEGASDAEPTAAQARAASAQGLRRLRISQAGA